MGDLYYFGARGLPRDQSMALDYYTRAANQGSLGAMCSAGGMFVKGEGGHGKNVTKALAYYQQAAEKDFVRALNGLGFLYFYGDAVEQNFVSFIIPFLVFIGDDKFLQTKSFEYFKRAADQGTDGVSMFNAGYCLEQGLGTNQSYAEAARLYNIAAVKFGYFDAVNALGRMHLLGQGVDRSADKAITYYSAAVSIGPWSRWIRRGLDHYLQGNFVHSLRCYLLAGEFGKTNMCN
jgi:TPR repeat protein